jgi:hypothetical protein
MNYPTNFGELIQAMCRCEQTAGQTVYQHGLSVWKYSQDLIGYMEGRALQLQWRLPDWIDKYKANILDALGDTSDMQSYCLYHDCGKPYCRQVDEIGKVRFPDHAAVSKSVYLKVSENDESVAKLIGWDMILHTSKAEEIERYMNEEWTVKEAITLLVAALAEVHSNASLFGGIESDSFKMKWKTIDKRGRQICKRYF